MMAKLGDFLIAINLSKRNLMEDDELTEKEVVKALVKQMRLDHHIQNDEISLTE